jgi:hypothetical protein
MADPLSKLRDIHVPPPPPTEPVWDLVLAGVLTLLALGFVLFILLRRKRHWRNEALLSLSSIDTNQPDRARTELARVLRRVAIKVSDQPITKLSGDDYLKQLDKIFRTTFFGTGAGQVFGQSLYRPVQSATDWSAIKSELATHIKRVRAQ